MLARRRILSLVSATTVALISGGAAWAATGGVGAPHAPVHAAGEVTTTTDVTDPGVGDTSTTVVGDTSTTTEVSGDTTTTVVSGDTSTTVPSTDTSTTVPACKPGWGYGDTNHCHSGPPGLVGHGNGNSEKPDHGKGHGKGHGTH